ncbi:MAG: tetratricopeptide repeat protein, partial [Planctomycetaceae bacterium]
LGLGAWLHLSKAGRRPSPDLAQFLNRLLDKLPRDGAILTVLGAFALDNRQIERARGYYERARNIPAAEEAALSGLLKVHYFSSEWEQALACADRLIEINPGDARVHAMRADILKALGRRNEGIESAQRALAFNPTLVPVREWLVEVYRQTGRDEERREQEQILRRMRDARPPR